MAKAKAQKLGSGVPQKHLHSRISYLHQAATYLASAQGTSRPLISAEGAPRPVHSNSLVKSTSSAYNQSRNLLTHLRAVSLKSQIRLTPELKQSFCRRCDSLLVPGKTSDMTIANSSRHGNKAWADILLVRCGFCGAVRRFPIGQKLGREEAATSIEAQQVLVTSRH
jgi:ribonuclease P protein subunit RPR2